MKRIAGFLTISLLLGGCGSEPPADSAPAPATETAADAPAAPAARPPTAVAADLACNIDQLFVDGATVPAPETFRPAAGQALKGAGWIIDAETGVVPDGVHLLLEPADPAAAVILQPLQVDTARPGVLEMMPAAGDDARPGFGFAVTRDVLAPGEYQLGLANADGALLCSRRWPVEAL
jgi:hypothetical protein